ncbi:hypothetical protein LINPERPRIM_LOCUS35453, partial [Linum perenne]
HPSQITFFILKLFCDRVKSIFGHLVLDSATEEGLQRSYWFKRQPDQRLDSPGTLIQMEWVKQVETRGATNVPAWPYRGHLPAVQIEGSTQLHLHGHNGSVRRHDAYLMLCSLFIGPTPAWL